MPLTFLSAGESRLIRKISGSEETRRFLMNLGFVSDCEIKVINKLQGNVIVLIKDARIALNADMAKHIMVS